MDTFFEQIVSIKKTGKALAAIIGIWFLAFAVIYLLLSVGLKYVASFAVLLAFGALYGAYKWCCVFNVEYEYIITNGTLDIDKITNKSSRKRVLSLELGQVSRLEKYNPNMLASLNSKAVVVACNSADEAYLTVAEGDGKAAYLVFAPDERLRGAMEKFVPKFIANSAFK